MVWLYIIRINQEQRKKEQWNVSFSRAVSSMCIKRQLTHCCTTQTTRWLGWWVHWICCCSNSRLRLLKKENTRNAFLKRANATVVFLNLGTAECCNRYCSQISRSYVEVSMWAIPLPWEIHTSQQYLHSFLYQYTKSIQIIKPYLICFVILR